MCIRDRAVGGRPVEGMIAFKHVERSAIRGHAAEGRGDVYVGVGVSIAVSVGGKVVGNRCV